MNFKNIKFIILAISAALITLSLANTQQTNPKSPGKLVYEQNCLSCHQADGGGVPGLNPPLSKVSYVTGNKSKLIKIILNGLNTPLEIEGETYHNPMPAHKHLSDQQIADVLTYIRSNFGNKASAVTVVEVKKERVLQ